MLITSRLSQWSASVKQLDMDVLDLAAATAYLTEATANHRRTTNDDAKTAQDIAEELGRLALGLEHAAAYINNLGLTFAEYLSQWQAGAEAVIAEFDADQTDYPREILITWKLTADRLSEDARRLLDLLCCFAPDPIPEPLLQQVPDDFPVARPKQALAELVRYSLARRDQDEPAFTLHRLVQTTTRHHLQQQGENDWSDNIAVALRWLDGAFTGDPDDVRTWPQLDPLATHAVSVCNHAEEAQLVGPEDPTSGLLNQVGVLWMTKARHAQAEPLYRRALAIDEQSFGSEHPNVAIRLNNLAQLLQATNRLDEAEPLMRRALVIDEQSFGSEHPNVARDLNNLAQLLQDTNRLDEAEPLIRRALAIDEQSVGGEHPKVAIDLNNLAQLLKATNRLDKAEPLIRRALAIDEQSFGNDHPTVARDLNNLATLLKDTNRLDEAEPLMRGALAIFVASLGADHPNSATVANNYRSLLQDMDVSKNDIDQRIEQLMQEPN